MTWSCFIFQKRVDVILVYMHWGKEYYLEPLGSQRKMAKELRSLGVHAIIGCHPHVLQPHCYEDDQVVAFSLGNFLFPWHIPQPVVSSACCSAKKSRS